MNPCTLAIIAVLTERFHGYPAVLQKSVGHPVQWIGMLIAKLDEALNRNKTDKFQGRLRGVLALTILLLAATLPAWLLSDILHRFKLGGIAEALLGT